MTVFIAIKESKGESQKFQTDEFLAAFPPEPLTPPHLIDSPLKYFCFLFSQRVYHYFSRVLIVINATTFS